MREDKPHERNSRGIKINNTNIKKIEFPEVAKQEQFNGNSLRKRACTPALWYIKRNSEVLLPTPPPYCYSLTITTRQTKKEGIDILFIFFRGGEK